MNIADLYPILNHTLGVTVASAFAVLVGVFWAIYFVTKKITAFYKDKEQMETRHSDLALEVKENRKESNERFERQMEEIRKDIAYIKGSLDIFKDTKCGNSLFQSHSPISLTKAGEKVANDLKDSGLLSRTIDDIINHIDSKGLRTPYDIQEYCIETSSVDPGVFYDQEGINFVKDYAYKNGHSIQLYLRLLGIVIRDEYFKRRNIDVNLVDDHR